MTNPRVLGIDPGTQLVGWAVAECAPSGQLQRIDSGVWKLGRAPVKMGVRLLKLHQSLEEVLQEYRPTRVALEAAFFGKNAHSALKLGEARGVVLLAAEAFQVPVVELPPATVKARVAGTGSATKEQVEELVRMHFSLPDLEAATADETDALAVAACALLEPRSQEAESLGSPQSGGIGAKNCGKLPPGATFQ